jgi:hypothetical protein
MFAAVPAPTLSTPDMISLSPPRGCSFSWSGTWLTCPERPSLPVPSDYYFLFRPTTTESWTHCSSLLPDKVGEAMPSCPVVKQTVAITNVSYSPVLESQNEFRETHTLESTSLPPRFFFSLPYARPRLDVGIVYLILAFIGETSV